ncbi:hypothetical protein 3, partial [Forsythia suspensa yan-like virus]
MISRMDHRYNHLAVLLVLLATQFLSTMYRKGLSSYSELVRSIADPHDHKPVRLPTYPSVERTSLLPLINTAQATVDAAGTSTALLIRSPAAPVWLTQSLTFAGSCYWRFTGTGIVGSLPWYPGVSLTLPPLMTNIAQVYYNNWLPWQGVGVAGNGDYWFWAPPGSYFGAGFQLSGGVTGGSWDVEFEYTLNFLTTETLRQSASAAMISTTCLMTAVLSSGVFWRPLSLTCTTGATGLGQNMLDIKIYHSTSSDLLIPSSGTLSGVMPLATTPPELKIAPTIYRSCRLNAVSALFQNTTAVLSKEGSVEAAVLSMTQSEANVLATGFAFGSTVADVAASCRYIGLLEKGLYTFSLPDAPSSVFRDCVETASTASVVTYIPILNLDSFDYVNVIRFTDYSSPATNLLVTVDAHLEFRNTSMLWPIGISTTELELWHKSQVALQGMLPFFENPTHLLTIANLARAALIRAYPYVRPIAMAAASAARDKLLNMASSALQSRMSRPQMITAPPA